MNFPKTIGKTLAIGMVFLGTAFSTVNVYAQDAKAAAPAAAAAKEGDAEAKAAPKSQSFFDIVFGGSALDITIWMLIFMDSFATLALIIDACISIRAKKIMPPELDDAVKTALADGDLNAAIEACEATPCPFSNILLAGFNNISEGYEIVMDSISSTATIEAEKLMQRVNYLNLCSAIAPMLGLLGTVTGMVGAFSGLATSSGAEKAAMLAMSISTALYTTAVGLLISLPGILGYTFVKNNAAKIILTMESLTSDRVKVLRGAEVVGDEEGGEEE